MTMPRFATRAAGLILAVLVAPVSVPARAEEKAPPMAGMKSYQLVLLRRAPGHEKFMGEREVQAKQEAYLAWLDRLHADGTVLVSGPVEKGGDLDSVLVLDVASKEDAAAILKDDPWVRAGKVVPEIYSWWAASNAFRKTSAVKRLTACWIGFLKRPKNAPQLSAEKLEEIQKGHLANIGKMAESKDLAVAGPLGEDTVLRGILVFRTDDAERIKALVAEDPAVKIGRLECELYRWAVPEGAIP